MKRRGFFKSFAGMLALVGGAVGMGINPAKLLAPSLVPTPTPVPMTVTPAMHRAAVAGVQGLFSKEACEGADKFMGVTGTYKVGDTIRIRKPPRYITAPVVYARQRNDLMYVTRDPVTHRLVFSPELHGLNDTELAQVVEKFHKEEWQRLGAIVNTYDV